MIFKHTVLVLGIIFMLLLSGCANVRTPIASSSYQKESVAKRQATLEKIKYWRIAGAFSIQQTGKKSDIANYEWSQFDHGYHLEIASALALYRVDIKRSHQSITLWKNGTLVTSAKTLEGLMQKALGWSLPIDELQSWIKGMPSLDKKNPYHAEYDAFGHLTVLSQNGWTLHYRAYKTEEDAGIDFPQVITIQRPDFFVKIVIKNWALLMQSHKMPETI